MKMPKVSKKKSYEVPDVIIIDDKKKKDDGELGKDEFDNLGDDDEMDFEDMDFDDGGD